MESIDYKKEIEEMETLGSADGGKSAKLKLVIQLIRKRGNKRTAAINLINSNMTAINSLVVTEISTLIKMLEDNNMELQRLNEDIIDNFVEAKEFTDEGLEILTCKNEDVNFQILNFCNKLQVRLQTSTASEQPSQIRSSGLKRPEITLPEYDGKPEEFEKFFSLFEDICHNYNMSSWEKYNLLLGQVKGDAKSVLSAGPIKDMNYESAKEILSQAFNSKILQQYSVIQRLQNLKLDNNFYHWVSEVKVIKEQIASLDINSTIFMQCYVWNSLPQYYKNHFMNITDKTYPNLEEILDNAFNINTRIQSTINSKEWYKSENEISENKTYSLATNINFKANTQQNHNNNQNNLKFSCTLCKAKKLKNADDHKLANCQNFKTPELKVGQIKELNGCTVCGFLNHSEDTCKFKLSTRCWKCNQNHVHYLCMAQNISAAQKHTYGNKNGQHNTSNNSPNTINTTSNTISLSVKPIESPTPEQMRNSVSMSSMNVSGVQDIILPTFTATATNHNNNNRDLRVLYDSGSEISFISKEVAETLTCRVVKSGIVLNIKGFNESKYYETHIIQIPIKLKHKNAVIQAAVVPDIKTKVNLPSQEIVKAFHDAKLSLADKHLSNKMCRDIHMILGVNSAHIIPVHVCTVGSDDNISFIYYTCIGILLAGNLNTLNKNIPHIKHLKRFTDTMDQACKPVTIDNTSE